MEKKTAKKVIGTVEMAQANIKTGGEYLLRAWVIGGQLLSKAKTHKEQGAIQQALVGTYIEWVSKYNPVIEARLKANKYLLSTLEGKAEKEKDINAMKQHEANALRMINKKTCEAFAWVKIKSANDVAVQVAKTRAKKATITKAKTALKGAQVDVTLPPTKTPTAPSDTFIFRSGHIRHDCLQLKIIQVVQAVAVSEGFDNKKLTEDDNYMLSILRAIKSSL